MIKEIDNRILYELDRNSRQSYSKIAKKIGTSKQVIKNHVEKLVSEGYIKQFSSVIDISKIGLIKYTIYLRLIRTSIKDEEKIISFLTKSQYVSWLVKTEGIFDLTFSLIFKKIEELNEFLNDFNSKFSNFISERVITRIYRSEFFDRSYLTDNKKETIRKPFDNVGKSEDIVELDNYDLKILSLLSNDARIGCIEIAKRINISADLVSKRIKGLEKKGIISGYVLILNIKKVKNLNYKVILNINNFNQEFEKLLLNFCKNQNTIVSLHKCIGSWEIEINIEAKDSEEYRNTIRVLKQDLADYIKEYHSLLIYEGLKNDSFPKKI